MSTSRAKMLSSLTDWVVPYLVKKGFKGAFPTFRRFKTKCVDIVTFQFTAFDTAFCVNIAKCSSKGITFKSGEYLPPTRVTALHCPEMLRLGVTGKQTSHWFKYNPTKHELRMKDQFPFMTMYKDSLLKYKYIADDIIKLLATQGQQWLTDSNDWWLYKTPEYNHLFFSVQNSFNDLLFLQHC